MSGARGVGARGAGWAVALGVSWWSAHALAAEPAASSTRTVTLGHTYYKEFCAGCHGPGAKGDGPDAKAQRRPVPDLTTLAARAGGHFDSERVYAVIEGKDRAAAHEKDGMPIWGEVLVAGEPASHQARDPARAAERASVTRSRIWSVVRYLETLQRPPQP